MHFQWKSGNGNVFPAKPRTASHFYRKAKSFSRYWSNVLLFCRSARLSEVWQKTRFRTGLLVLILNQMWKVELKHPYKSDNIYMIGSWRVLLTFTSHFYMYQSFILSKKLISKNKLTGRPSPTVQLMKTGFSLCGNTTQGKPCSGPVLAL